MFREKDNAVYVTTYALEVYLPYDYLGKEYRGTPYYTLIGSKVQYLGIGNMRAYKTEKEMENPASVPVYPLGIPMLITSEPSEIDTRDVVFVKGGRARKCIVLTFYKDDAILTERHPIKNNNYVMMLMARIEGGKLDHVMPETSYNILDSAQKMNSLPLRMPPEELEIFIVERYRNPDNDSEKVRFSDDADMDDVLSLNMRADAMKTTTYQALTHEDINTALISSINRGNAGIVDKPTIMERIVRGMDLTDLIEERDRRYAAEENRAGQ